MKRNISTLLSVLAATFALSACTQKLAYFDQDSELTSSSLKGGTLVIGGYAFADKAAGGDSAKLWTATAESFNADDEAQAVRLLRDEVVDEREGLKVLRHHDSGANVPRDVRKTALAEMAQGGELSGATLADLAKASEGRYRYVVFVRVSNDVFQHSETETRTDEVTETKDKNGTKKEVRQPVVIRTFATTRKLTQVYHVYDLKLGRRVAHGIDDRQLVTENQSQRKASNNGWTELGHSALDALTDGAANYPAAAARRSFIEQGAKAFAASLPEL